MTDAAKPTDSKLHDAVIPAAVFLPFALVTTLFAFWGFANDITNPLVKAFSEIFLMNNKQGALVQTAFYGGYATMAIPAAIFIRRFSYKAGILLGLALYATGALLFIPAAMMMQFWVFLVALYILTFGLAFLETTANPYILAMGPESTATRRLNLAQAFNPMGSLAGMFVATHIVLASLGVQEFRVEKDREFQQEHKAEYQANLAEYKSDAATYKSGLEEQEALLAAEKSKLAEMDEKSEAYDEASNAYRAHVETFKDRQMPVDGQYKRMLAGRIDGKVMAALEDYSQGKLDFDVKDKDAKKKYENHKAMQAHDLNVIRGPYVALGLVIVAAFCVFAAAKLPKAGGGDRHVHFFETFGRLLKNERYVGGVIAQTFYVGAQIMCWTCIIHYGMKTLNMSMGQAQTYNMLAMAIFCGSRFICTFMLKYVSPGGLLMGLALGAIALTAGTIFVEGMPGLYCLIGISACMSLMFPTIYGIALDGLGDDAKLGSAGLIFAIVGGALMPLMQTAIIDMGDDITGMMSVGFMEMASVRASFFLPMFCFVVIAGFGFRTHQQQAA